VGLHNPANKSAAYLTARLSKKPILSGRDVAHQWSTVMKGTFVTATALLLALNVQSRAADGNASRGQRVFGTCAACHSLQPDKNMTGPSLANLWGRKAGTMTSFDRYSAALKSAGIVWSDQTLDEWLKDPKHLVPQNEMTFPGIKDAQQRADLLAFLKEATQRGGTQTAQQSRPMDGMLGGMGMMGAAKFRT